jgi:hypothetical protein
VAPGAAPARCCASSGESPPGRLRCQHSWQVRCTRVFLAPRRPPRVAACVSLSHGWRVLADRCSQHAHTLAFGLFGAGRSGSRQQPELSPLNSVPSAQDCTSNATLHPGGHPYPSIGPLCRSMAADPAWAPMAQVVLRPAPSWPTGRPIPRRVTQAQDLSLRSRAQWMWIQRPAGADAACNLADNVSANHAVR